MKKLTILITLIFSYTVIHAQEQLTSFGNLQVHPGASLTFFGNFTNNGTFTDNGLAVAFKGTGTHSISSTSPITLNNLIVDAAVSGITMNQNITISTSLVLTAGPFSLNSRTLIINNNAAAALSRTAGYILSEQTNNSGKVQWNIGTNTSSHVFPFGTSAGTYIPLTLAVTAGDIGNVTVSTYPTANNNTPYPTTPVAITHVNRGTGDNSANVVDRFWQIDKDGPSGTATVTFAATAAEVGAITDLVAQRWNSATSDWEAPLAGQSSTATSVTVPGITTFSPWTLSGNNLILPIELLSFTATVNNTDVELQWKTASEIDNDFFTVQRSFDGIIFSDIAQIQGSGTSRILNKYNYVDENVKPGKVYYRLKQTDFDGGHDFSEIRMVEIHHNANFKITAYPNPVKNNRFTVDFSSTSEKEISIEVYDLLGKKIFYERVKLNNNKFEVSLSSNPAPGIYLLKVWNGLESDEQPLIIK